MRLHVELDDELVASIDRLTGRRGRTDFVRRAVETAVEQASRWAALEKAAGSIADRHHEWDDDPATWVQAQRHTAASAAVVSVQRRPGDDLH